MPEPHQRESESFIDSSPPSSGLNRCLSTKQRLTHGSLFPETFAQKQKWVGRYMVIWKRTAPDAQQRIGTITSKKLHLRANKRNFARRRLREAYRNLRPYFSGQFDLILIGRRAILSADWNDVMSELLKLAQRAKIIAPENLGKARAQIKALSKKRD